LRKLSRQQGLSTQLAVAESAARYAKVVIHKYSDAGVPSLVDLRTWRAMIAPWVLVIGLYCYELGRWLQRWRKQQLQALQQPKSSISSSKAAADAVLLQFNYFEYKAEGIISELNRVASLWESGTNGAVLCKDDSSCSGGEGSSKPAEGEGEDISLRANAGAALVEAWQQWQQPSATAAAGQKHQWQQPAATATAGVQASAATAATSRQAAALLTGDQEPPPSPPQQQQQQQQVPAYGSLEEEFSLLKGDVLFGMEDTWHAMRKTRKHLKQCAKRGSSGAHQVSSSSGSSEDSDTDDSLSEADGCSDVGNSHLDQDVAAAQSKVTKPSTIQSSMQACLGYQGFTELAELLQGVGEAICAKVPVPWMCNNPGCTCMAGASELQLVGGKACVCGGCRVAR
jgi:hypothetical protein